MKLRMKIQLKVKVYLTQYKINHSSTKSQFYFTIINFKKSEIWIFSGYVHNASNTNRHLNNIVIFVKLVFKISAITVQSLINASILQIMDGISY